MWKTPSTRWRVRVFFQQAARKLQTVSPQSGDSQTKGATFPQTGFHIPQPLVENISHLLLRICSEFGVDVGSDVAQVILQRYVGFEGIVNFIKAVNDGGMVPAKFPADLRQAHVGHGADKVHGNLSGFRRLFIF